MTVNLFKSGLAALATLAPALVCATQITILNGDGNGEGFNDPTPVAAVGGNNATTLGAQRLAVFERAADILESTLDSDIPIAVFAQFNPLDCSARSAVLGQAGASTIRGNFPGAPLRDTWYPIALANDLANSDLNANSEKNYEISATFNGDIDNNDNCLAGNNWYYGFDDPEGPDNSLLSVVVHELLHGLGFTSAVNADGTLASGYMDVFSRNLFDQTRNKGWDQMTPAERLSSSTNDGNLVWNGNQANSAANALPLSNGLNAGKIQMYAPSSYEGGSSVSHFSTAASPNELMEPSYTEFLTSPGLAAPLLADLGWTLANSGTPDAESPFTLSGIISADGFSFSLTSLPSVVLMFADGSSVTISTIYDFQTQVTFSWNGDLTQKVPVQVRVDHPQAQQAVTRAVLTDRSSDTVYIRLLALENNGGTLDLGGSGGGGSPFSLLLLLGIIEFLRRKAFTG